jgi:hypothetical protein
MLSRDKKLRSLERLLLKGDRAKECYARDLADIVGVFIGVKPAMLGTFSAKNEPSQAECKRFEKRLRALGLVVLFYRRNELCYVIAKSQKKAQEALDAFVESWAHPTPDVNVRIGKLMGYPDTAIRFFAYPHNIYSKEYQARLLRNRFYVHSKAHEDEEFEFYEAPIYKQLSRYCPKATKILRGNEQCRWLD